LNLRYIFDDTKRNPLVLRLIAMHGAVGCGMQERKPAYDGWSLLAPSPVAEFRNGCGRINGKIDAIDGKIYVVAGRFEGGFAANVNMPTVSHRAAPLLIIVLLTLIMLAPVMRFWIGGVGSFQYTICRSDSLLVGVLLAWLYQKPPFVEFLRHNRVTCRAVLSVMIVLTSFVPLVAYGLGGVANHFWFAILYGVFLTFIVVFPESGLTALMRQRFLVWLGVHSYFIYLSHQGVCGLLHGAIFSGEPRIGSPSQVIVTSLSLIVVLFLARVSYRYFESPFLCYGRKFSYRNAP
jgi:peptidoglycan/LPS O-acetylase OafA/YrhL